MDDRARERLEILTALEAAINDRRRLFAAIDQAQDAESARLAVMRDFNFTLVQATAVLDLQLFRFAADMRRRLSAERTRLQEDL